MLDAITVRHETSSIGRHRLLLSYILYPKPVRTLTGPDSMAIGCIKYLFYYWTIFRAPQSP